MAGSEAPDERGERERDGNEHDDTDAECDRQLHGASSRPLYALFHLQLRETHFIGDEPLGVVTQLSKQIRNPRVRVGRNSFDGHPLTPLVEDASTARASSVPQIA